MMYFDRFNPPRGLEGRQLPPLVTFDNSGDINNTTFIMPFPELSGVDLNEDASGGVIASAVITVFVATVFVAARFYTRTKILSALGKEDWFILLSLVFSLANSASTILQTRYALGRHYLAVSESDRLHFGQVGWLTLIFYAMSLGLTKISILLLYIRILTYSWARTISKIMLVLMVVFHTFIVLCIFTACVPLEKFWSPMVDGYCHPQEVWWANTGGNIASDFLIILIPLPVIFTMQLPIKQKLSLCFVFMVGFFVCMVSIIRLFFLLDLYISFNPSFDNVNIANWTCIEINTAIVCACLTTLKPLVTKICPRFFETRVPTEVQGTTQLTVGSKPAKPLRENDGRISGFSEYGTHGCRRSVGELEDTTMVDLEASKEQGSNDIAERPLTYQPFSQDLPLTSPASDRMSILGPEVRPIESISNGL